MEQAAARTAAAAASGMSALEAKQVLNLVDSEVTKEAILAQYRRYYAANDMKRGGSLYVHSAGLSVCVLE